MPSDTIRQLIEQGKTRQALEAMRDDYPEASVLLNKLNTGEDQYHLGTIDYGEWSKVQAQVVVAALALLNRPAAQPPPAVTEVFPVGRPLRVFLSYAHADEALQQRLNVHLAGLKRSNKIETWNDRDIQAGVEWDDTIKQQLENADIILLLVSADFIASDYIWEQEVKKAMERHRQKQAVVIPVFLKRCDWKDMPFGSIQGLPRDAKPIASFDDPDEGLVQVAQGVRAVVDRLKK